jgi:tetratricopeptide (TPR) repeat protein/ketosteroid isomerase-like protein
MKQNERKKSHREQPMADVSGAVKDPDSRESGNAHGRRQSFLIKWFACSQTPYHRTCVPACASESYHMSKRALAASLLLASLICSPVRADPLQDLQALVKQGQFNQALERADQMLASKPRDAQVRFLKGVVLSELNRGNDAIAVFQKLTEDYPELPEPYNNLAVLYAQQRQYDKARNALEMAIRTHPSYATAHENLGDIYARLASQAYDKALALDSSNQGAQSKLAMIRDMMSVSGKTVRPAAPAIAVAAAPQAPAKPAPSAVVAPAAAPVKPVTPPPVVVAQVAKPATPPAAVPAPAAKSEPKPVVKRPEPKDETPPQAAAITKAVNSWASAWSNKDVKSYLTHYGRDFAPPKGMNRKDWEVERNQRLTKPGDIAVELENIKVVSVNGDRAIVKFRQHYRSANLSTSSNKTIGLVLQDGKWVIQQERVGG